MLISIGSLQYLDEEKESVAWKTVRSHGNRCNYTALPPISEALRSTAG
jgi:hypothetical protein